MTSYATPPEQAEAIRRAAAGFAEALNESGACFEVEVEQICLSEIGDPRLKYVYRVHVTERVPVVGRQDWGY